MIFAIVLVHKSVDKRWKHSLRNGEVRSHWFFPVQVTTAAYGAYSPSMGLEEDARRIANEAARSEQLANSKAAEARKPVMVPGSADFVDFCMKHRTPKSRFWTKLEKANLLGNTKQVGRLLGSGWPVLDRTMGDETPWIYAIDEDGLLLGTCFSSMWRLKDQSWRVDRLGNGSQMEADRWHTNFTAEAAAIISHKGTYLKGFRTAK